MIRKLLVILLAFFWASSLWAQRTVSGTVTSAEDGSQLPGVTVVVVGTQTGTITDADGAYSIQVPDDASLQFSYIGYINQVVPVSGRSVIDINMEVDVTELQEVVVTALGVERETKALGYSVSEVEGDKFTKARENNLAHALSGRVAGVNVTKVAGGPAASSRVIIRGNKSLLGGNQPLYVVDGIPMDNSGFGQAGIWGGRDEGDGLSSMNPNDIESITVLKGANAAALYGSRAANGVILITTKKGTAREGIGIEFNSNYVMESVNDLREYQKEYGQGNYVLSDPTDPDSERIAVAPRNQQEGTGWNTTSWGPRLGSGTFVDVLGETRPYVDAGDNWDRFYQTGNSITNSLSFTGGNETQNFRVSIADLRSSSIIPNTGFDRFNGTLSTSSKFGEKVTFVSKVMYSHEYAKNRPYLSDSPANGILAMYYVPTNMNVNWYKGDPNKLGAVPVDTDQTSLSIWGKEPGEELPAGQHNWHQNPWWTAYQFDNDDWRDRVITSGRLRYDITDFLWVQGRAGMDWYVRRETDLVPQGTSYQRGGSINEGETRISEINLEWILGFSEGFGDINVNAFVGGNWMRKSWEDFNLSGRGFNVPFFEAINNSVSRNFGYGFSERGINSLFGSVELGYNNILFITGTGRQDWFSVLNPDFKNEIFYPSIGASFVFSDAFDNLPTWLSFGKLRASWAQVGGATVGPYSTRLTYSINSNTHNGYTLASFSSAMGNNGLIPNPEIKPLTSTEIEFGLDLRLFEGRAGVDLTYYTQKTEDDILRATISRASGFGRTTVNVGEIQNKGVELLLTGTPVEGTVTWDIAFNYSYNDNEVIYLDEGVESLLLEEPRTRTVFTRHIVGEPYGTITGYVQKRSPDGKLVFDSNNGQPIRSDDMEIIGYGVHPSTAGITNSVRYGQFNLSFLIDFRYGGDLYSGTNVRLTQTGLTKQTLQGREGQDPITVEGVTQIDTGPDGEPVYEDFSMTLTPSQARGYWGAMGSRVQDHFVYDGDYGKLRQVTLGYNFPRSMLANTPIQNLSLSIVGRNLAILFKKVENIDPESSYNNNNGGQGLDYFGFPSTRTFGFNLSAGF